MVAGMDATARLGMGLGVLALGAAVVVAIAVATQDSAGSGQSVPAGIYSAEILADRPGVRPAGLLRVRDATTGEVLYESTDEDYLFAMWAPPGNALVAFAFAAQDRFEMVTISFPAFEQHRVRLPADFEFRFNWASDGSAIAIASRDLTIYSRELEKIATVRDIVPDPDEQPVTPVWSPDSKTVAVSAGNSFVLYEVSGQTGRFEFAPGLNVDPDLDLVWLIGWEGNDRILAFVQSGVRGLTRGSEIDREKFREEVYRGLWAGGEVQWEPEPSATGFEAHFALDGDPTEWLQLSQPAWELMGLSFGDVGGSDHGRTAEESGWYFMVERSGLNIPPPADWPTGQRVAVIAGEATAVFDTEAGTRVTSIVVVPD